METRWIYLAEPLVRRGDGVDAEVCPAGWALAPLSPPPAPLPWVPGDDPRWAVLPGEHWQPPIICWIPCPDGAVPVPSPPCVAWFVMRQPPAPDPAPVIKLFPVSHLLSDAAAMLSGQMLILAYLPLRLEDALPPALLPGSAP